ncbi:3-hydroxy-5-phosphonooxypentane-2,4-dione thiolase [Candidatus Nitrosotenuis chungbukensis]|uniref:3-hydroxy-5-phosphonooxypentane-2,4-dione thiolase n=1 Tax=Candidatus Nitrosotenuis chungbukensis TaxID=1353246 RepID=UPI00069375A5|nr:3-hydroxy-5-phosphonooxypentane-2,4-dione thiolase [Candidatus Nitrosotenuis chungbukensis]WKT57729.1 3-hydroxy-5-phosphonooxypentane-2,4-dione thiolase [Candidatus Nitrosotenuis chungbukensis]
MDWGLKNRIASIIKPTNNRGVMLAIDHGYFLGPTEKLEVPKRTISPLLKYCDSLMVTRGIVRTSVDPNFPVPIVLRVSGGSSIIGEDLSNEKITTSVKDAVRINASALATSIFVGAKYEHNSLVSLGNLVNEAEEYGLPVLAVTAVGKELAKRDARYLSLSCRIAAEFGAHIVKTYYCDNFEKVVNSCPVPVIIAGGPKIPERDALALTYNGIKAGAAGVDMGRNIWQSQYPIPMIRAVRAIVHSNYNLNQAYELFKKLCKEYPVRNNPSQNFPGRLPQNQQRPQQNQPKPQQNQQRPQQKPQQNQPRPQQNQQRPPQPTQQQTKPQQTQPRPPQKQQPKPQQNQQRPQQKPQQPKPQQNQPRPPQKQQPKQQQNQQRPQQKPQQPKPQQQSKPKPQKSEPKKQPEPAAAKTQ